MSSARVTTSSSPSLSSFLAAHKRVGTALPQTHTWFSSPTSKAPVTLHIPRESTSILRETLLRDVIGKSKNRLLDGANSITEKVCAKVPFVFFADIDFSPADAQRFKVEHAASGDWKKKFRGALKDLVLVYRDTVSYCTGKADVEMVVATRLPYKIHLHFPGIVVEKRDAVAISDAFKDRLRKHPLFREEAVDASVYSTGLRLLYCHKGCMGKDEKRAEEVAAHERLFGKGSWSGIYEVTDVETWEKKVEKRYEDLVATSIVAAEDAAVTRVVAKGAWTVSGGKGKRKEVVKSGKEVVRKGKGKGKERAADEPDSTIVETAVIGIATLFDLAEEDIAREFTQRGSYLVLSTRIKDCPFAKRTHQGNHLYIVICKESVELRCHDEECVETRNVPFATLDTELRYVLLQLLGDKTAAQEETRKEAIGKSLTEIKKQHPRVDLSGALKHVKPSNLGGQPGYMVKLPNNRWCPVCMEEHDRPGTCVLTTKNLQQLICTITDHSSIDFPLAGDLGNVIFANIQNLNVVNVNVTTGDENEVRDFGSYDAFPQLFDNDELNRLCHGSLSGRTRDVAKFAYSFMSGHYVFQERTWYRFNGRYWKKRPGPDDLLTSDLTAVYVKLQDHFRNDKQVKWLNQLIDEVGNMPRRKAYMEDLERVVMEEDQKLPLNEQCMLLGFENGVFDAATGDFRDLRAEDYITDVLPYDLPTEPNEKIRKEINDFFEAIMPGESERNFLWTMLAMHLNGSNNHSIAMVWSGSGGNGKSMLSHLMSLTFRQFHDEPPATYFTSERPSPEKPCPLLFNQRHTRCVIASEPESGKKCNTSFIKFITGGDLVKVRNCHSNDFISFIPRFPVTMLCNEIPLFDGASGEIRGLWRRLKIFKFRTEFTEDPTLPHHRREDPTLKTRMATWPPHFMAMLIEEYRRYLQRGRTYSVPDNILDNIAEQKEENSPMESWLKDNLVQAPGARIHYHRFDKAYKAWADQLDGHLKPGPLPRSGFSEKLISLGYKVSMGDDKTRDYQCCQGSTRYVIDIDVKNWPAHSITPVSEFLGVSELENPGNTGNKSLQRK